MCFSEFFKKTNHTFVNSWHNILEEAVHALFFRFNVSDSLFREKEKTKAICDDLDSTFAELTGF